MRFNQLPYDFNRVIIITLAIGVVLLTSLALTPVFPKLPFVRGLDIGPIGHYTTHILVAALIYVSLNSLRLGMGQVWQRLLITAVFSLMFGIVIEVVQMNLVSRTASALDVVFNLAGTLTFIFLVLCTNWAKCLRLNSLSK